MTDSSSKPPDANNRTNAVDETTGPVEPKTLEPLSREALLDHHLDKLLKACFEEAYTRQDTEAARVVYELLPENGRGAWQDRLDELEERYPSPEKEAQKLRADVAEIAKTVEEIKGVIGKVEGVDTTLKDDFSKIEEIGTTLNQALGKNGTLADQLEIRLTETIPNALKLQETISKEVSKSLSSVEELKERVQKLEKELLDGDRERKKEIEEVTKTIDQVNETLEAIREETLTPLQKKVSQIDEIRRLVEELTDKIKDVQQQIPARGEQMAEVPGQISTLVSWAGEMTERLTALQKMVDRLAVAAKSAAGPQTSAPSPAGGGDRGGRGILSSAAGVPSARSNEYAAQQGVAAGHRELEKLVKEAQKLARSPLLSKRAEAVNKMADAVQVVQRTGNKNLLAQVLDQRQKIEETYRQAQSLYDQAMKAYDGDKEKWPKALKLFRRLTEEYGLTGYQNERDFQMWSVWRESDLRATRYNQVKEQLKGGLTWAKKEKLEGEKGEIEHRIKELYSWLDTPRRQQWQKLGVSMSMYKQEGLLHKEENLD